jgi:hypothetical protein
MKATRFWMATLLLLGSVILSAPSDVLAQSGMGTIDGTLMDNHARPVSGIVARAIDVLDPTRVYTATSDASGVFQIASVPAGSYQVAPITANTPWLIKDATPMVDVKAGGITRVNLVLVRMGQDYAAAPLPSGGGTGTMGMVALAAGLGAAGLGVVNAIQISDLDDCGDDCAALQDQIDDLTREFQAFREDFDEFRRQVASEFQRR